ncbi:HNH endonuclease [Vibrio cholerae]|uniref:HNH endonuclease n=1 Tax=Vibrio cholerae TaxID=666 RepID=UPI00166BBC20|nr:HNH endonuclease [Vibrio cholerae]
MCKYCNQPAPFEKPFLEVHHLIRLIDHGQDNTGVYPNCHRRLHSGKGREDLTINLLAKIEEKESGL